MIAEQETLVFRLGAVTTEKEAMATLRKPGEDMKALPQPVEGPGDVEMENVNQEVNKKAAGEATGKKYGGITRETG